MRSSFLAGVFCVLAACSSSSPPTDSWVGPPPILERKAAGYQSFLERWHTGDLGGLTAGVQFTGEDRTEIDCVHHQGDSMIWTGMYLASQALRYRITGAPEARGEILRMVDYIHNAMDITQTPGYLARYAGIDRKPYNCHYPDDHGWKNHGTGPWEGYYWVDHTSRDQYSGALFGLSMAFDATDDPDTRAKIQRMFAAVVEMLVDNEWNITDQNGEWTGNGAAWVGPIMRLSWLVQAAHVIDEPTYWELLDAQFRINQALLSIDTWAGLNRYSEYYGNNLRHLAFQSIFRLWPDRGQLEHFYEVWQSDNRPYVAATYNPWFDAVHVTGCRRLGLCEPAEMEQIARDALLTLEEYWDPPSYVREVTCSELPLDPFSVWADEWLAGIPWLEEIVKIDPQTDEPRRLTDRHWTDMYWQSTPFERSCHTTEDRTYTGPGMDYLLAYYMGLFYGLLPGAGPYEDG